MSTTETARYYDHSLVQEINEAIDSYPRVISRESAGETQAPYDAASLADIFAPRVRQLLDLQSQGFTHVRWGFDTEHGFNRWFGVDLTQQH